MSLAPRFAPIVVAAILVSELTISVALGARPEPGRSDGGATAVAGGDATAGRDHGSPGGRRRLAPTGPGVPGGGPISDAQPSALVPTRIAPALPAPPPVTVPVLYYHKVSAIPSGFASWPPASRERFLAYDVLPSALAAQLDWLLANGYTTILPRDLADYWDHGVPLPAKPVIITFDDGFRNWTSAALPLLQSRHMVAEFYLTIDAIRARGITWPLVRELAAAGNGIGAHDDHHVQLVGVPGRADASEAHMRAEVTGVRDAIFSHVGILPDSLAYVGGGFDATLERVVQEAGYTTARTILRGITQTRARRYAMRVVRVGPRDDVADLMTGAMVPGLPTFTARMAGVPDHTRF